MVGDLDANCDRVLEALQVAEDAGCDLAVFPEMTITGYPAEDLVLKHGFVADNQRALEKVAARSGRCAVVVGFADGGPHGAYNAAALCVDGQIAGVYHKQELPNYDVFDEKRTFLRGQEPTTLYEIAGVRVGLTICEDLWVAGGPVNHLGHSGCDLVININGSPFHAGKGGDREDLLRRRVNEAGCPIVYVNLVGGQDELVFDGSSMVMNAAGELTHRAGAFVESVLVADIDVATRPPLRSDAPSVVLSSPHSPPEPSSNVPPVVAPLLDGDAEIHDALVLATRDYVRKSGFSDVTIGLSGGIDSSVVAAIAVAALGPDRVHGVLMPSRYSSQHSVDDAVELSQRLGIDHRTIAIEPAHGALVEMLAPSFAGRSPDLTEENLQSRIRGVLLMALANKFGWLVLTTGNKSESAVGYSTLYGDTAGAYAVIKDLWKLQVYDLARHVNERAGRALIPLNSIAKAPSAELRPDQRDDQSLPPYEVLDPVLRAYVEDDKTMAELIAAGFDAAVVQRVTRLVDISEYKRRQTPLGPRVSTKGFGRDRRLPIVNRYRG